MAGKARGATARRWALTALSLPFLLVLGGTAAAVPIASGQIRAAIVAEIPSPAAPVSLEPSSVAQASFDVRAETSGAGQGNFDADLLGGRLLTARSTVSAPGPSGRAVVEFRGEALYTFVNDADGIAELSLFFELCCVGTAPFDIGGFASVDDPLRERAFWKAAAIVSDEAAGPCFDLSCALAQASLVEPLTAPDHFGALTDIEQPDFTLNFIDFLGPGETRAFWLTAFGRAEAVRASEPASLVLICAALGAALAVRRR